MDKSIPWMLESLNPSLSDLGGERYVVTGFAASHFKPVLTADKMRNDEEESRQAAFRHLAGIFGCFAPPAGMPALPVGVVPGCAQRGDRLHSSLCTLHSALD
jgi:hypothetical protein